MNLAFRYELKDKNEDISKYLLLKVDMTFKSWPVTYNLAHLHHFVLSALLSVIHNEFAVHPKMKNNEAEVSNHH